MLNIQYIVFAFDRYLTTLSTLDETVFIKNTKEFFETKKFKVLVSVLSFGLCIFVFFEFWVNYYNFETSFPYNIFRWIHWDPNTTLIVFKGINYSLNNLLFLLFCINCLMLLIFRCIDLSLIIVDYLSSDDKNGYGNICWNYNNYEFCSIFFKYADFCYILSNFFNLFIYLGFNRKFRDCFNTLFKKIIELKFSLKKYRLAKKIINGLILSRLRLILIIRHCEDIISKTQILN